MAKIEKLYTSLEQDTELVQSLLDNGFKKLGELFILKLEDVAMKIDTDLKILTYYAPIEKMESWEFKECVYCEHTKEAAEFISNFICLCKK